MGGSGIVGDIVRDLLEDNFDKPIYVCKKSTLPLFANKSTLFVSVSYSGNTIETIYALKEALKRKCKIFGIVSNGKIEKILADKKIPYVKLPSGYLPREALPFMLFSLLNFLGKIDLINLIFNLSELENKIEEIENKAKKIAPNLNGKLTIIYTHYQSIGHRFKSQLNENSKALAKYDLFTEFCHNEINSWQSLNDNYHILFLRDNVETKEVKNMIDIIKNLLDTSSYTEIVAKGSDKLNRMLYLILLGDFVSYYLAKENKVDPKELPATNYLKKKISNIIKL
jgi:glucose/mannose-6-phosphate isomerase